MLNRLVIIERRSMMRDLLTVHYSGLKHKFPRVTGYGSVAEALEQEETPEPRPVLFLIGGNDLLFVEQSVEMIRAHRPLSLIVVLDHFVRQSLLQMVLDRRIEGYVTFHETLDGVLGDMETVARGERIIRIHGQPVDAERFVPFYSQLAQRERQLLRLLVNGCDLYECSSRLNITVKSVDNLKTRLMQKTGVHSTTDLVLLGIGFGLRER